MQHLHDATNHIRPLLQGFEPEFGIILGTGLGALVKDLTIHHTIPYASIPNFPVSTVESHSGNLLAAELGGRKVLVMQGRFHYYEGYTMEQVVMPVRVMKMLGIRKLFVSNAAGGLHPDMEYSDLMLIEDHINLQPTNPLIGRNLDELGPRFPDMLEPYDATLLRQAQEAARSLGFADKVRRGVYVSVPGPMLETPAEYRYLRTIGADAVGMSTVPEVIAAVHMGLPVLAISVITDLCAPDKLKRVAIADILRTAAAAEPRLTALLRAVIEQQ
ncbi:purine-nucleoside phosphorylase [Microvirga sp. STR05]|uniref:Purine nucleoside phosphorylase n=1 Tax=Hymenobacter duratus TaxID=2771356 RepID=A0ABR8JHC0_9BACT|nr:purine-nucleoside phosphorylase [Hymenobacter duratus]MBD2715482.1 purine-nucleoside phosphorylase [Hymenobacter duratus]MBR7950390.1 purine-nucleoside phosphorylase [Microvirga sp. STR05]